MLTLVQMAAKPKLCSDATKIPNLVVSDPPRASAFSFFIALFYFLLMADPNKNKGGMRAAFTETERIG